MRLDNLQIFGCFAVNYLFGWCKRHILSTFIKTQRKRKRWKAKKMRLFISRERNIWNFETENFWCMSVSVYIYKVMIRRNKIINKICKNEMKSPISQRNKKHFEKWKLAFPQYCLLSDGARWTCIVEVKTRYVYTWFWMQIGKLDNEW